MDARVYRWTRADAGLICIRCNHDSKRRDRRNRSCPKCRGQFAFEPRDGDPLTDLAFQNALDAVSAEGHLRWGVEHLYYEVCRRGPNYRLRRRTLVAFALVGIGLFSNYVATAQPVAGIAAVIASAVFILAGFLRFHYRNHLSVTLKKFNSMWQRWLKVHGKPDTVLVRRKVDPKAAPREADVVEYSFDRVIICDRARTVDLLLANNFHFENNCAVLSVDGYPKHVFATVLKMLRRNPRLEVYALHDATRAGCALAHKLGNARTWFPGSDVVDIGLSVAHARRYPRLLIEPVQKPVTAGQGITAKDAKWLSVYALELAALRPEQIIRAAFIAINGTSSHDSFG